MATTKKTAKKQTTKASKSIPWYQNLLLKIGGLLGLITLLASLFGLLDDATSIWDKFYHPNPKEISVSDSPVRVKYDKKSGLSIKTQVKYILQIQTYLVDQIDEANVRISDFKIKNSRVINSDSITSRSLQLQSVLSSSSRANETQSLDEVEYSLNVSLVLLPSIANAKSGKIYDLGYALFSVPYFVNGLRKIEEQKIPIELEVK